MTPDTRLDAVTQKMVADCRLLGLDDQRIHSLFKDRLRRTPGETLSHLAYGGSPMEYEVIYTERGSSYCAVHDADETEFRFKFLREFVMHCGSLSVRNRDTAKELLLKTRDDFGHTQAWTGMLKEYRSLFPDAADLPSPFEYRVFGHYPQTADSRDRSPIEWIVLEKKEDRVLLLSWQILDAQPYNALEEIPDTLPCNASEAIPHWETCSLRYWLNHDFLSAAFSAEEQSSILLSTLDNSAAAFSWAVAHPDTQDRVFLLSPMEVVAHYFEKLCRATLYAAARMYTETQLQNDPSLNNRFQTWALRIPAYEMHEGSGPTEVGADGRISMNSFFNRNQFVCPAVWIRA